MTHPHTPTPPSALPESLSAHPHAPRPERAPEHLSAPRTERLAPQQSALATERLHNRLPGLARALTITLLVATTPMLGTLAVSLPALAIDAPSEMLPDPKQEARAEAIGSQLRCLVCQNESIEDSGAGLARDLRRVVRERVTKGDSNQQVIDWMVARYGNFIRLSPPFNATTALLWGMPLIAVLAGIGAALVVFRRRPAEPAPLTDAERARLADLEGPGT